MCSVGYGLLKLLAVNRLLTQHHFKTKFTLNI